MTFSYTPKNLPHNIMIDNQHIENAVNTCKIIGVTIARNRTWTALNNILFFTHLLTHNVLS